MKVEKVIHETIDKEHTCFLLSVSKYTGEIKQLNFYNYEISLGLKGWGAVGIWKPKTINKS